MDFTKTLICAREKAGLSQWELSRESGISRGLLSLIETGKRTPPLDCLTQLITALGMTEKDASEFREAAFLAHAPDEVRSLVRRLRAEAINDRAELDNIRAKFSALVAHLRASGHDIPKGINNA